MTKSSAAALTEDEFVELEELLAAVPEEHQPMASDEADGYLTGLLLNPKEILPEQWMPFILDAEGKPVADMDEKALFRLESLLYKRYQEIDKQLSSRTPIDPVILEPDEDEAEADELAPFATGFLTATQRFPGILATRDKAVGGALIGIFRHLPAELRGDLEKDIAQLDRDSPLASPEEAFEDFCACVAEVAEVTRGFTIKP